MPIGSDPRPYYFDTSALVKLVVRERESTALARAISAWPHRVTSELTVTELLRAASRLRPDAEPRAIVVLQRLALFPISRAILDRAAQLQPSTLRALDAIHLATALSIASSATLAAVVTYDRRMIEGGGANGLAIESPS